MTPAGTVFVELKRPGESPTPLQLATHAKLRRHGAEVHVVSTLAQVDELVAVLRDRSRVGLVAV